MAKKSSWKTGKTKKAKKATTWKKKGSNSFTKGKYKWS